MKKDKMILQYNSRLKRFSLNGLATIPHDGWVTISDNIPEKAGSKFIIKMEKFYKGSLPKLEVVEFDFAGFMKRGGLK